MLTVDEFVKQYTGWAKDVDGAAGVQCVDLAKEHFRLVGVPNYAAAIGGDGYADNIWYNRQRWADWYTFVDREQIKDGDMVIFPSKNRGGWTHPYSHVCFYYKGQEFGTNQGQKPACLKSTDWSDALGALRCKQWGGIQLPDYESDLTLNGHLYHMYKQSSSLRPVVLSPGLNRTAPIRELDTDAYVYAKITGCNYFQMRDDLPDQPYGTTYGDISAPLCGVYQNLPNQSSTMFFDLETGEHNDCTDITIDIDHNVFSPVLIYPTGQNVQYARMVGLGLCNSPSMYSFVIRFVNGTYALGITAQELTPNQINADFRSVCDVESISIIDGGGSAQMMRYLVKSGAIEYTRDTGRATAGCIAFIGSVIPQNPNETAGNEQEPITPETPSEKPETGSQENDMSEQETEVSKDETWTDPEPSAGSTILARLAALLSVKSIITIFLTVVFGLLVLKGEELPDKFVSIYTMCISFFFGYQFKKADGGK